MAAARYPPSSEPANTQFLRPSAITGLRRTGDHAGADDGIEHPGRDRDHRAGGCPDMDEPPGPAPLAVERANALFEEPARAVRGGPAGALGEGVRRRPAGQ